MGSVHRIEHPKSMGKQLLVEAANFTECRAHAIFNTVLPEWRNWQTQQTQNLPGITPRVGSTPSSGTNLSPTLKIDPAPVA